jgi:hypothetical protein
LFAILGSLLVALLVAALVVPPYVDWNRFKSDFEAEATRALGQDVKVRGTASLRLLPLPSVTFSDVRVGPEAEPLLTARSFAMDVELAPLMRGDIVIVDMRLERPQLEMRLDDQGQLLWPLGRASRFEETPIAVERLAVIDGIMRVRDPRYDREIILREIDFSAGAASLSGPWRGEGSLRWGEERARISASTGRLRPDDTFSVRATIEPQSVPFDIAFEGLGDMGAELPGATGTLRLRPAVAQSADDRIAFPRVLSEDAFPFLLEADAEFTTDGLTVPAYELRLGGGDDPYSISGKGSVEFGESPSFDVSAEGQQVNVERLETAVGETATAEGQDLEDRLELLRLILARIPHLPGEGKINLTLPAFVAGDTVIRDIKADITALGQSGTWRLQNFGAQLPGRTELRADGVLTVRDTMAYEGALVLASRQPTGFAKWLGRADPQEFSEIANAGFSAQANLQPDRLVLEELEIVVNGDRLTGRLERIDRANSLELKGRRADLDKLQVLAALLAVDPGSAGVSALSLDVEQAVLSGLSATGVTARSRLENGEYVLDTLRIGDLSGAQISAAGRWPRGAAPWDGESQMRLQGASLAGVAALVNARLFQANVLDRFANNPALTANADLTLTAVYQEEAQDLAIEGVMGGITVDAAIEEGERFRAALTADDGASLINFIGFDTVPGLDLGRGGLTFRAEDNGEGIYDFGTTLTLQEGYASLSGAVEPQLTEGQILFDGAVAAEVDSSDIDPLIPLFGIALPGYGEGNGVRLSANIALSSDGVEVGDIVGKIAESEISGAVTVAKNRVDGRVAVNRVSAGSLAALSVAEGALLGSYAGDVALEVGALDLGVTNSAAQRFSARMRLDEGDVVLDEMKAAWLGGELSGRVEITNGAAGPMASINAQVRDAQLSDVASAFGLPAFMTGRADIAGRFETGGGATVLDDLTGGGNVSVRDGALQGLSSQTFGQVLAQADEVQDDEITDQAASIVTGSVGEGQLQFGRTDFTYSVTSGTVRADSVPFTTPTVTARAGGRFDLTSTAYEAQLGVDFDPGLERVEGASPGLRVAVEGIGNAAETTVDTTDFTTYLTARLAERREREFLTQRAAILERQRLRWTARLYQSREDARRAVRQERERAERERREAEDARRREREAQERQRRQEAAQETLQEELRRLGVQDASDLPDTGRVDGAPLPLANDPANPPPLNLELDFNRPFIEEN